MLWSRLFTPTLRHTPAEAEAVSHQMLLRAGYMRQSTAGVYNLLPLGQRSMNKIERILREEMDAIGAQEFHLSALQPAELWQESGRFDDVGDNLFKLKDRSGRLLVLAMTHEEAMTTIARDELRSYRQLPQIWYQIQTKFRDEARAKSGLLRVRQFRMKDSYSFDLTAEGLDVAYEKHAAAYRRIFDRCGLRYLVVEAHSGSMGGSHSQEFMVETEAGEDWVACCQETGYAANVEKAVSRPSVPAVPDHPGDLDPELVYTPGQKTIDDVAAFLAVPASSIIKSLVLVADSKPVMVLLRGDYQLSETKFQAATGCAEFRPALAEEMRQYLGADAGSLGPVGQQKLPILIDEALRGRRNLVCGANRDDYHLINVTPDEDFAGSYADLRQVAAGDSEALTGARLELKKTVEIAHIFKLGYKYSKTMGLNVLDQNGVETPVIMGSYGVGMERVLASAAELYSDANGLCLPAAIAPFEVVVTPVKWQDAALRQASGAIYAELLRLGVDALHDDRDLSPGVKFKDADLIGVPWRITVGKKLSEGLVEISERRSGQVTAVAASEAAAWVRERVEEGQSR